MILSRSIHISTNDTVSFLFMAEYYAVAYMYHNFFTRSSVDGHLFSILPSLVQPHSPSLCNPHPTLSPYNFVHKVNSLCLIGSCFHYKVFSRKKKKSPKFMDHMEWSLGGLHSRKDILRLSPAPSRSAGTWHGGGLPECQHWTWEQ